MRATLSAVIVFTLAFAGLFYGGVAIAAQGNAAHTHIGHVADGWRDTPDNQGLLPTAIAEAKIAAQHAALAAKDPSNLDAMKRHTGHVVNAVDPEAMANGPGLGYGVKRAAAGAATHIELAAKSDGASGGVTTHSNHIATSARNTVARADEIIALAGKIQMASSASAAAPLVAELNTLAEQLITGVDANGDGRTGWQEGEGGLQQAEQYLNLLKKGEGLP